jgi:hypothetical protein
MMTDDRRMFAPLRRGDAISPEAKLVAVLKTHEAGATAAALANELLCAGLAVGAKAPVTKRVEQLLDDLEHAARVERIPDGRYRAVRSRV